MGERRGGVRASVGAGALGREVVGALRLVLGGGGGWLLLLGRTGFMLGVWAVVWGAVGVWGGFGGIGRGGWWWWGL